MKIVSAHSSRADTAAAVREAGDLLRRQLAPLSPDLLLVHWSPPYDGPTIRHLLRQEFPACRIHGASSCQGVMTEQGVVAQDQRGLGLLALSDPRGAYGVHGGELGPDPGYDAGQVVLAAIANAGRPGEMPDLVRISATPGCEEAVIAGIEEVLGSEVPIIGGSAADNQVSNQWEIISELGHWRQGLVATVCYPSTTVSFAFHNGYSPTAMRGRISKGSGRIIAEIDHRPAAEVYNEWTGGLIAAALPAGGSVLHATTLFPLGRVVGKIGGAPYYSLAHPDQVMADGSLRLFADLGEGEQVTLMQGTVETLISRAGRVAQSALQAGHLNPEEISGALVVYCAGCMLTVRHRIDEVVESLNQALGGRPFLGTFTFGEQGCFTGGENRHANLMISVIVFSNADNNQR